MRRQEGCHLCCGSASELEALPCRGKTLEDGAGSTPIEDPASHRLDVHDLVHGSDIVRGDVAPKVAVLTAQGLGPARDDEVHPFEIEERFLERPRRRDGVIDDQAQIRGNAPTGAHDQRSEARGVHGAKEGIRVRFGEDERALRCQRFLDRRVVPIVDNGNGSTHSAGKPLEVLSGLVVALPQQHRVGAGLEETVKEKRAGLHSAVGQDGCPGAF